MPEHLNQWTEMEGALLSTRHDVRFLIIQYCESRCYAAWKSSSLRTFLEKAGPDVHGAFKDLQQIVRPCYSSS